MLTIKEICAQTGIPRPTFQSWRRDYPRLLPSWRALEKGVIFYDDSILERIRFIKEQKAAGKKLREIADFFESYHNLTQGAGTAELVARLGTLEADFKRDLYSYKLRIEKLFRDFQRSMTENNASAFLGALSANGLACLDQAAADEVMPPPLPAEINLPEAGPEETAAAE